jgi:hypothetical protein
MRLRGQETSAEAWLTGTRCIPYALFLCDVMSSLCTYCRAVWLYLYAHHWHGLARLSLFLSREKVCSARSPEARLVGTTGHAIRCDFFKVRHQWSRELELALTSHRVDAISETASQSL